MLEISLRLGIKKDNILNHQKNRRMTSKGEKAPPQYPSLKSEWKAMIVQNKTAKVLSSLLDLPLLAM